MDKISEIQAKLLKRAEELREEMRIKSTQKEDPRNYGIENAEYMQSLLIDN